MQLLLQEVHGYIGCYLFAFSCWPFWLRQCFLIHLLVLVQRNSVNLHRHSRHHIWRLLVEDKVVHGLNLHLLIADDVGSNEFTTVLVIESLYGSILNARELANNGLHLFQLDAETTNLHLTVSATYKLDISVRQVAHNITSAISTDVFLLSGKWILNEYFCIFIGTVQVAECHLWSGCPQFTQRSHRQTMSLLVDDIKSHIVQRFTNGNVRIFLCDRIDRDDNGGFCGAIAVVQLIALRRRDTNQLLTSYREMHQGVVLDVRGKLIAHLCRHKGMGDVLALQIFVERYQVQSQFLRNDKYGGTTRQWRIDTFLVYIETVAGIFSHIMLRLQVVILPVPVTVAHQIAMRQLTAFGYACRAACIE